MTVGVDRVFSPRFSNKRYLNDEALTNWSDAAERLNLVVTAYFNNSFLLAQV